jgi:hypothetical protein
LTRPPGGTTRSDESSQPSGDAIDNAPSGAPDEPQGHDTPAHDPDEGQPQGEPDWKALSRRNEAKAKKASSELAALRKQLEQMVSPEQVADKDTQLVQAQQRLADLERDALRWRVATVKGLPPELAERLIGSTEEEMSEDADRLASMLAKPVKAQAAREGVVNQPPEAAPLTATQLLKIATGKG